MNAKCGSARNRTYVSVLPVGCLNHSTTEPTTLETPPITDLNVVRSDRLGGSEVILIPEGVKVISNLTTIRSIISCVTSVVSSNWIRKNIAKEFDEAYQ